MWWQANCVQHARCLYRHLLALDRVTRGMGSRSRNRCRRQIKVFQFTASIIDLELLVDAVLFVVADVGPPKSPAKTTLIFKSDRALGVQQSSFGLGNRTLQVFRSFYPFVNDYLNICQGFFVRPAVCCTAGQLGDFRNISLILFVPIENDFVSPLTFHRLLRPSGSTRWPLVLVSLGRVWLADL